MGVAVDGHLVAAGPSARSALETGDGAGVREGGADGPSCAVCEGRSPTFSSGCRAPGVLPTPVPFRLREGPGEEEAVVPACGRRGDGGLGAADLPAVPRSEGAGIGGSSE